MIRVYDDLGAMSRSAAGRIADLADRAVADHGRFTVVLSGGQTPRLTYELLAQPQFRDRVPWRQIHVFWGDERCVPPNDEQSNERMAREALLAHVPIPPEHVHPIDCSREPAQSAAQYEAFLRKFFEGGSPRFDLVILGLGDNAHTASLFPDTPVLDEEKSWAAAVQPKGVAIERITLTAPVLNQAASIVFLVSGASKAEALRNVLEGKHDPHRLPAQLIKPVDGEVVWLVDRKAAALLKRRE